jgi:hypothetical protein
MHEQDRADLSGESGFAERNPEPAFAGLQPSKGRWSEIMKKRPFNFWRWEGAGAYLEFLAGYIIVLGMLQVVLGRWKW